MTNFTAEQIIKISEIFSRVVDCKGNLKVFNGAWDKYKNYTAIYEEDSNGNKSIQATYSTKVSLEDIYNNAKKALSICNVGNIVDINIITPLKTFDISSKVSKAKIGDQADAHFSVLLHQCPDLKEEDFNTLYNAFYDVLAICGYDFNSSDNHTILYLNIFQRLIDYFKDGKIKFDVKSGTVGQIDSGLIEKLKECYEINKFVCKIKLFIKENYTPLKSLEIDWDKFKNNLDDINKELFDRNSGIWRQVGKIAGAFYGLTKNDLKNIIYYGAPGTGKTKFVKYCLDILDPNRTRTEWVQFHSGFEYEDFIDGIKPIGIQNGNLNLALTNGIFKEFCLKAAQNTDENFFFIVDEINRADIAAVFGETLSLLEENYRGKSSAIKIKNSTLMEDIIVSDASKKSLCIDYGNLQTKFYIPANIYFIGMMNDVDKSIDCFDLALRRRFAWGLMECDYEVVENATDKAYETKCESLNNYITKEEYQLKGSKKTDGLNLGRAYEIGHSYFLKKEAMSEQQIWNRHIEPILREYIRTQFGDRDAEDKLNIAREIFVG